jgi:hypothetical protein
MKWFYEWLTVALIVLALPLVNFAQDSTKAQNKERVKFQNVQQEKVQLQDKNQNKGTVKNKEQNKVIHGPNFVDKNGDGVNDNAPDHDNDGIPNGQDPDYQGANKGKRQQTFVDNDGDGIADNARGQMKGKARGQAGYGPGDGTGNKGVRPQDGTGLGKGAQSGNCDGTGPKGKTNRGGKR